MNPETPKWLSKAEGDFHTARRELRARREPNYDAACFHAQQGVEKYLKAVLIEAGLPFSKTHDLLLLLDLCLSVAPLLDAFRPSVAILKNFAVHIRYPGEDASRTEARDVLQRARAFVPLCANIFGWRNDVVVATLHSHSIKALPGCLTFAKVSG